MKNELKNEREIIREIERRMIHKQIIHLAIHYNEPGHWFESEERSPDAVCNCGFRVSSE